MECQELRGMLDAYIDDELSADQVRELKEHASACNTCARELKSAELARAALRSMAADEVSVPLETQAAWRNAVRAEANKRALRRRLRVVYAAAAALVVVLGSTLLLESSGKESQSLAAIPNAAANISLIARDGADAPAVYAMESQNDYDAWKKIEVAQVSAAIDEVDNLVKEYSGSLEIENGDVCYVRLPAQNLDDFLSAVGHVGTELDSETMAVRSDAAVVYIQFIQKQ